MTKITCKHCGRHLFNAIGNCLMEEFPCPGCKAKLNFNITFALPVKQQGYKFQAEEKAPRKLKLQNA